MAPPPVPVVLVGAHGHGRWHLQNVGRLARTGAPLHLVGICDPQPLTATERDLAGHVPVLRDLDALLAAVRPRATIVCTPIHTHAGLALTAAAAGSHVLLEKPPTPTLAGFDRLRDGLSDTGSACQVGFQSLGSHALRHARALVAEGAIGRVTGIGAAGAWRRDASYYARAPWAGRRVLNGEPVVDGALTNPFAHATATALALDGDTGETDLRDVRVELFRANPIEADDTSCLRLVTARGTTVTVAVTLCADREVEPYLVVHGTHGRLVLTYRTGRVRLAAVRPSGGGHRPREHRPAGEPRRPRPFARGAPGRTTCGDARLHAGGRGRPTRRRAVRGAVRARHVGPAPVPRRAGHRGGGRPLRRPVGAAVRARPALGPFIRGGRRWLSPSASSRGLPPSPSWPP